MAAPGVDFGTIERSTQVSALSPAADGLDVVSVSKAYGQTRVLEEISFACPLGSVTGLLGPNGSGKSTAMRIMLGLASADAGTVTYDAESYRDLRRPGRVVGSVIDPAAHHHGRTVAETLASSAILLGATASQSREMIEALGLGAVRRRRFGALSLGMKQRVSLAIALLGRPRYLILDEPMNGLDIETSSWLRDTLVSHARDQDGVVLLSTHLLQELQGFADRMVVLNRGKVGYAGAVDTQPAPRCAVSVADGQSMRTALAARGIAYRTEADSSRLRVEASAPVVGRIAFDERILIEELVVERESIRDTYERLTQGEYVARVVR